MEEPWELAKDRLLVPPKAVIFVRELDWYRLEALEPRILCLAHQGPLVGEDARKAFEEAREAARSLCEEIRNDPRDEDAIINELYPRFYRDELALYTSDNIIGGCRLVIRRSRAGQA